MDNRALIRAFKLTAQLLELHDENPFKIRAIEGTATRPGGPEFPWPRWSAPACPTAPA